MHNTIPLVTGLLLVLAAQASVQAQTKSTSVTSLGEGEVIRVNPQTGSFQKSNKKLSAGESMGTGARELGSNVFIFKRNGKLYMQDEANTEAAIRSQMFENE
jgi:hypothetical protein